jgi:hypothetical protein
MRVVIAVTIIIRVADRASTAERMSLPSQATIT